MILKRARRAAMIVSMSGKTHFPLPLFFKSIHRAWRAAGDGPSVDFRRFGCWKKETRRSKCSRTETVGLENLTLLFPTSFPGPSRQSLAA